MHVVDVCRIVLGLISENICENTMRNTMVMQKTKHGRNNIWEWFLEIYVEWLRNIIKYVAGQNLKQTFDGNFIRWYRTFILTNYKKLY